VQAVRWILRALPRHWPRRPELLADAPAFLRWSACRLARAIRERELRSEDVVDACIRALQAAAETNAIAVERFAEARAEAAEADRRVAAAAAAGKLEELPPFLGVPMLLKEAFEYPGLQYTNGLLARKGQLGARKGPVVRRAEAAGFIFVASGNVSEACMWMESYNPVYGRSSSPFDLSRTCGGSSGGTAAGVAALGAPVGITADIGGSTRIPALFCGLFGHKPTGGLIANTGSHLGNFHGAVCRICQPGVVTRHAEDLGRVIRLLSGPPEPEEDPVAAEYLPRPIWKEPPVDFKRLTVVPLSFRGGLPSSPVELLLSSVSAAAQEGQAQVVAWLAGQGCRVRPAYFEDLDVGTWFNTWADLNQTAGGPSFREVICQGKRTFGLPELLRYFLGASRHTVPALGLAFLEDAVEVFAPPRERRLAKAKELKETLQAALGDYGVFVLPILPRHAQRHDEPIWRLFDSSLTCVWNAMEFPATAVPLGLDGRGLPVGLQLVSSSGLDELTLGLAAELERAGLARCVAPGPLGA